MLFVRFFSICACLVLSVSSWCLGRATVCDCGIPWTFLYPFLIWCNGHLIKEHILGFSCPLHHFENTWHCPPCYILKTPSFQLQIGLTGGLVVALHPAKKYSLQTPLLCGIRLRQESTVAWDKPNNAVSFTEHCIHHILHTLCVYIGLFFRVPKQCDVNSSVSTIHECSADITLMVWIWMMRKTNINVN